jgi:ferredoxin
VKLVVNKSTCTGIGICEARAPQAVEVGPDGTAAALHDAIGGHDIDSVRAAVDGCPTGSLQLIEER